MTLAACRTYTPIYYSKRCTNGGVFEMLKFVECHPFQLYLIPTGIRHWVPGDNLAHFALKAVERV